MYCTYQSHDVLMSVISKCKSLRKLAKLLKRTGYTKDDRKAILGGVRA